VVSQIQTYVLRQNTSFMQTALLNKIETFLDRLSYPVSWGKQFWVNIISILIDTSVVLRGCGK